MHAESIELQIERQYIMAARAGSLADLVRSCLQPAASMPAQLSSSVSGRSAAPLVIARSYTAQPAYSNDPWPDDQEAAESRAQHSGEPGAGAAVHRGVPSRRQSGLGHLIRGTHS